MRSRQPRQLILALVGEFVIDGDPRPVPASAFIEVLEAAGIAAATTRATLDRVEQRGLLERERRGREIVFSPTPMGVTVLREATARVRDPHPFHAPLGEWTFVTFSLPEDLRSLRSRLRSTLTWEGFAPLRDGLWAAPGQIDLSAALEAMRADLPPAAILAFHGRELPGFPMAGRSCTLRAGLPWLCCLLPLCGSRGEDRGRRAPVSCRWKWNFRRVVSWRTSSERIWRFHRMAPIWYSSRLVRREGRSCMSGAWTAGKLPRLPGPRVHELRFFRRTGNGSHFGPTAN